MSHYYDRQCRPITFEQWVTDFEEADRRVALDERGDVRVSTVWLGIDHNFGAEGPPILFETMVFGGPMDEVCWRYATEAQALAGHAEICSAALREDDARVTEP